jgi:hypothetical protein
MKRGLTLVEVIVGLFVLTVAILPLILINSTSNQMTLDSYYQLQALQLAMEPIEVFRAVGYPQCTALPHFPLDYTEDLSSRVGVLPPEVGMFERTITMDTSGPPPYIVTVVVAPRSNSIARYWMRRKNGTVVMKGAVPFVK